MSEKEWYSDWFDSKYYHVIYKNRDNTEAEHFISNLIHFLQPQKEAHILDLACGKGRHSTFLNEMGFRVTGLDLSSNSIQNAIQYENDRLNFAVHDMRNVYSHEEFEYIFNLFTSFGYFNSNVENQKVLFAIENQLKQGGILVLDYLNADKVIATLKQDEVIELDGIEFVIRREITDNNVVKSISFQAEGKQYNFQERVELLNKIDFINYFNATSLRLIHTFGSYDLQEYIPTKSDRLILLAKKEK